ncbi:P-loop containing nucleoside triphosphate hydrolase protein [Hypoxylon argillaceum]|nr:P-loop containing nucleoside triphosphate hydrolase protein [Hypoxylon argillaceum]
MLEPGAQSAWCSTIPYQRNHGFFGRENQLREIDRGFLNQSSSPNIKTVAIWGTGGIGKSQIALEYAHQRWNSGTSVVLWICSETEGEVAKSIREAAETLQLDGYSEKNTPDVNRHLLLKWLQTTNEKWLIIFDNLEDEKILTSSRPKSGHGDVLITCRSKPLAESIALLPIEVITFSTQESVLLIFQILNREAQNSAETKAAESLAKKLGGLALAIDIIVKNIKASCRFNNIADFLLYYEEHRLALGKRHRQGIRDITYPKDLDTVWETAFAIINPIDNPSANSDAMHLMEILCLVAPEEIPQFLFQAEKRDWQEGWDLLNDNERFEEAKRKLVNLSLIRIDDENETGLISIHRLVQQAYFEQMTTESRQDAFNVTFLLLRKAFPNRNGEIHLYNRWRVCEKLHQHVQALHKMLSEIRYMLELQQFISVEALIKSQLLDIDAASLEYASMNRILVGLFERTGRSIRALECAKIEFDIFVACDGPENDLANAYSDMGYSYCSAFKPQEALKYLDKAVDIALSHSKPDCYREFNVDRFLRNRGRAKAQLGAFGGALDDFTKAEYYQAKIHGEHSHYDGEIKHERAKIAAIQGELEEATALNQQALELVSRGKPAHSSVAASHYRQGYVLLLSGQPDDALREFEKAHAICQFNEPSRGNSGESARILWRMAQIYEQNQRMDEAQAFLNKAERIRSDLLATGDYAPVEKVEDSWDSLVGLLYR